MNIRYFAFGAALALVAPAHAQDASAVIDTYADIALATYTDSHETAQKLDDAIKALIEQPTEENLAAARQAWREARVPYQQTEVFRFGNPLVDEWEGRVNAWPLDEGLIDYVDASYGNDAPENALYTANVIANEKLTINGEEIDLSQITPEVIANELHEAGEVEANVASGYHAIEFLLWGQDLNGTQAGAGNRPATDFDPANCTSGHCERRAQYLASASSLLLSDLQEMVEAWGEGGAARKALEGDEGLSAILTGMGSLSFGELAGERMKLGLLLHDPEEEHDCFSDNTHNSHLYDVVGIQNVYLGRYESVGGEEISGASLYDLVRAENPELAEELKARIADSRAAMEEIAASAEAGEAYDQQIAEGNEEGNARVQAAIDALIAQTRSIERVIAELEVGGVSIENSDSLSAPEKVFE